MWTAVLPYLINPLSANLGAETGFMYSGFRTFIWRFVFLCMPQYLYRSLAELDEIFIERVPARQFKGYVYD